MTAVRLEEVTKTFGTHVAVDNLSLEVPTGSIYGFIGPNGSGKTTTLRMIMRILHPDRGDIAVLGERSLGAADDRVGYLPEERGLYKQMTVRHVLRFYPDPKAPAGTLEPIQDTYGTETVRVPPDGDVVDLDHLPGVVKATDFGRWQELRLEPGADPQRLLAGLMERGRVRHFELARPTLHDIF